MTSKSNTEIIFVAGFPRSGTTWFSNLINSHSKVIYRHELIGRNYGMFGESLLNSLKYDDGLTDEQYQKAMSVVYKADINTDKPPFFAKETGLFKYPKLHHGAWLASKFLPPLRPLYGQLFKVPSQRDDFKVLIKETRSTRDMSSMLNGLRVQHKLFLVRVPHGSIASHLSGIKQGRMAAVDQKQIADWLAGLSEHPYIKSLELTEDKIAAISVAEYFAIHWRIYHEEMLKMVEKFADAVVCFYEDFVAEPELKTKALFNQVNLEYNQSVATFIEESSGKSQNQPALKDSNNEFYSVYRGASFKADSWKEKLTEEQIAAIDKHTSETYQLMREKFA